MLRTLQLSIAVMLCTGCVGEARVGARYTYVEPRPELVYVSPGVYVIADYDYPVFYSNNYYWRYDGGVWYRSRTTSGGWAVSYNVPVAVRRIDRPAAYVHYRANVAVRDHRRAPSYTHRTPVVRDHRDHTPARRESPQQAPVVRDHRHGRR